MKSTNCFIVFSNLEHQLKYNTIDYFRENIKDVYGIIFSEKFLGIAGNKLKEELKNEMAYNFDTKAALLFQYPKLDCFKLNEEVQFISMNLSIHVYSRPVIIYWASKSCKIYKTTDTEIDEDDIYFWYGKIDKKEYFDFVGHMRNKFRLPKTYFEFQYNYMMMENILHFELESEEVKNVLKNFVNHYVKKYNEASISEKYLGPIEFIKNIGEIETKIQFHANFGQGCFHALKTFIKELNAIKGIKLLNINSSQFWPKSIYD